MSDAQHGYYFEELSAGMSDQCSRTLTDADVFTFASLTGDDNPMHLDDAFAARGPLGERVVHGMLTASLISTVVGTLMPGPGSVYVSQTLRFLAPVRIGDTVTARATVTELMPAGPHVRLKTECVVDGRVVVEGEAVLHVPSRNA